jgi:hypothetical protein
MQSKIQKYLLHRFSPLRKNLCVSHVTHYSKQLHSLYPEYKQTFNYFVIVTSLSTYIVR